MDGKAALTNGNMSLLSWKAGQEPNIGMLYLGSCCTCWVGYILLLYSVYKELNRFFPKYDISMALVKAIIPIWSWATLDSEIEALAKEANVTIPKAKFPALICIVCGIIAPFILADQMQRVNALCKGVAEKGSN